MQLVRHPADRVPLALFLAVFAVDLLVLFGAEPLWVAPAYCALLAIPKGWISSFNHHHQHRPMLTTPWANRLLELVFGFQTGVTSHAWFLHHVVGHHVHYLDQEKDESRWRRPDGRVMGEVEYALDVALTAYPRAWRVGARYPRARRVFLVMGLVQLALLGAAFALRPWNALWLLVAMATSLVLTAWATYFHHSGLQTDDHLHASYNILHPLYNRMTGNLGYHTAHHSQHGLHWSELPALHARIEAGIPQHLYRKPGIPFVWFGAEETITRDEALRQAG